ncbi:MAG: alpha/beta hydrolase [Cyanobacteria bacterium J06632_22]
MSANPDLPLTGSQATDPHPPLQLLTPITPQPQKPLFIFLPGMDGTGQLLQTQLAGLAQGFDIRCLAIAATNQWTWSELTRYSVALLRDAIFATPRSAVYLCGESFGGCLALQLATQAPQLFSRLILVNPASSLQRLSWMQWGAALSQWLPEPLYRLGNLGLIQFLIQPQRVTATARQALWQAMASVPAATALWRITLLSQFQSDRLSLDQLTLPTLLLAGQADALLPSTEEIQRLAQRIPQAQTLTLPHSGHACLLEEAVDLYALMAQAGFLGGHRGDPRPSAGNDSPGTSPGNSLYSKEGSQDSSPFVTSDSKL